MEGILNFIIIKIRVRCYTKLFHFILSNIFLRILLQKKKKKKYRKHETKIFNRKKKKKKVLSLLDSSLVIVTNNRKSISSHDSRGVPIESSLHNRISKVFLFVYPVPRKGRSSPARPIERDIRFYECLASRLRLLEKKKKKAATGKNRKTRDTRGRGYGRIENIFPAFQHGF